MENKAIFNRYELEINNIWYKIKNVYIFKDNKIKIINNHFEQENFIINGDIKRKIKVDLKEKNNFIIKHKSMYSLYDNYFDLYINGDLNDYKFLKLELKNFTKRRERLDLYYLLNGKELYTCVGWNNKETNKIRYHEFKDLKDKIDIDKSTCEEDIKDLLKLYRKYKKTQEIEENYTINDLDKMSLESGNTEEENKIMLVNNGLLKE